MCVQILPSRYQLLFDAVSVSLGQVAIHQIKIFSFFSYFEKILFIFKTEDIPKNVLLF